MNDLYSNQLCNKKECTIKGEKQKCEIGGEIFFMIVH